MKPRAQLILGVLNSMATALAVLIMAPVYLQYLGAEAYGLIGFYSTLLMCMQVFDMGMATTLNREIARHGTGHLSESNAQLLRCVELVYATVSVVLVLGAWVLGAWLANAWFTAKNIPAADITYAMYGIVLCVALRLPINVYQSALFGAQKMHLASTIGIAQIIAGVIGSYILLRFQKAGVVTFFVWQVVVALLHLVSIRSVVWRYAPQLKARSRDWGSLRDLWRYAAGAGLISIAGLVLSQVDKVVLSKTLDLEHYGYYMLATTLAACIFMLVGPLYNVFFPVVSKLIAQNKTDELLDRYQFYSASLVSFVFPLALYLVLFLPQLVGLWLHKPEVTEQVSSIGALMVIAASLHAVMHLPHALNLASGVSRTYLAMYFGLIILSFPITIFLSIQYGAIGGAWGQIILFVCYTVAGTWITHRNCLQGYALNWLLNDIGRPLGIVVFFALISYVFKLHTFSHFGLLNAGVSFLAFLLISVLCILAGPSTRSALILTVKGLMSKYVGKYS